MVSYFLCFFRKVGRNFVCCISNSHDGFKGSAVTFVLFFYECGEQMS